MIKYSYSPAQFSLMYMIYDHIKRKRELLQFTTSSCIFLSVRVCVDPANESKQVRASGSLEGYAHWRPDATPGDIQSKGQYRLIQKGAPKICRTHSHTQTEFVKVAVTYNPITSIPINWYFVKKKFDTPNDQFL